MTKRIIDIRFRLCNVNLALNFMVVGTFNSDRVQLGLSLVLWRGGGNSQFLVAWHHGWGLWQQLDAYPMVMHQWEVFFLP